MEVLISNETQTDKAAHDYVLHGFADVYVLFDDIRTTYRRFVSRVDFHAWTHMLDNTGVRKGFGTNIYFL